MVHLREPVPAGAAGTVTVSFRDHSLLLPVSVVHTGKDQLGLKFVFESDKDRNAVERLVSQVAASGQSGPRLVH